jgi:hypothetical protein
MNKFANLCLSATSLVFPAIVLACIIQNNAIYILSEVIVLAIMFIFLIKFSTTETEVFDLNIKDFSNKDFSCLWIFSSLIIPLARNQYNLDKTLLIVIAVLLFVVIYRAIGFFYNPLFLCFGWHFYSVSLPEGGNYTLITKKTIKNIAQTLTVSEISDFVLIGKE